MLSRSLCIKGEDGTVTNSVNDADNSLNDKLKAVEAINNKLRRGEVVGFFAPKPRGLKSAEMWEKYIEAGCTD